MTIKNQINDQKNSLNTCDLIIYFVMFCLEFLHLLDLVPHQPVDLVNKSPGS
jgi:hypothetical protein